jgi:SAM-dependent methyltransferase
VGDRREAEPTPEEIAWFADHFDSAPGQIVDFLASDGISLEGARVADVGSGDGIVDLGLCLRARPEQLVGFDIVPTDRPALLERAREAGAVQELPVHLEFLACAERHLPADDASFDYVVSWSTFEHVVDAAATAAEIARILKTHGVLFLQLYPFFHSGPGSHLWTWFPDGYAQLLLDPDEVERRVEAEAWRASNEWRRDRLADFRSLNRLTVDSLQGSLTDAGLVISKVELITQPFHVPAGLQAYRITDLGITGIKLLAYKPPA